LEQVLGDLEVSDACSRVSLLKYFNPIGRHLCGLIGESLRGIADNTLPLVAQIAAGKRYAVTVLGKDYDTIESSA
jgi:UDP-glucose 4-epimerase